jgi:4a-hydroxytetrahydrobiopterin dehydratase
LPTELTEITCEACKVDAPVLLNEEISAFLPKIPSWVVIEDDGIKRLVCYFKFLNYKQSINFTNLVAQLAEEEDHHPEIILEWGKVTVSWWSHKIKGLHKNDFICAAKSDEIYKSLDL